MLGQLVLAARGQKDHFTITGTEHPTPDGTGVRDYVHVWDLARAHVRAVERFDEVLGGGGRPQRDHERRARRGRDRPPAGRGVRVGLRQARADRTRRRRAPATPSVPTPTSTWPTGCCAGRPSCPSRTPSPPRSPGPTSARRSWATSDLGLEAPGRTAQARTGRLANARRSVSTPACLRCTHVRQRRNAPPRLVLVPWPGVGGRPCSPLALRCRSVAATPMAPCRRR